VISDESCVENCGDLRKMVKYHGERVSKRRISQIKIKNVLLSQKF